MLYWFIKEYAPEFSDIEVVGVNTYMEHPQIRERMHKNCDRVLLPELKPFEIKEKYGSPCFSKQQDAYIMYYQKGIRSEALMKKINGYTYIGKDGKEHRGMFSLNKKARDLLLADKLHKISPLCCKYLKKKPFHEFEKESGKKAILGVKADESIMRKSKYTSCFTKNKKFTPLYDLTDELEAEIYAKYNIEIPEVYNYIKRTGCMGCPYGSRSGYTERELDLLNDAQRKFVCQYFKESYDVLGINYKIKQNMLF